MDQVAILILTVPIVLPLIKALGFDPVWFGVIVIVVAEVGLVTPPVGLNVFVVSRYAKRPLQEIFAGVWPHVVSHLMLLAVLVAFPVDHSLAAVEDGSAVSRGPDPAFNPRKETSPPPSPPARPACSPSPACAAAAVTAGAQTPVKLKIADSFPVGHYLPKYMILPMMERLKAQGVEFEYYPAEQMGKAKDFLALTQSGVVDISYVAPGFVSDKMPLSVVTELPLDFTGSCKATLAYWNLAKPGGLLDKKEFAPNGVRLLFTIVLPPYQIVTRKPFASLKDIEGMKIRVSGSAKELVVKKLKAIAGADAHARRLRVAVARHDRRRAVPVQQPAPYDIDKLSKTGRSARTSAPSSPTG